jgi:hypothetical protein
MNPARSAIQLYRLPVKRRTPPPMMAAKPRIGGNGTVLVSFLEAWTGPKSSTFFSRV